MSEPRVVTRTASGYVLHLGRDERALVSRLLEELRVLLTEQPEEAPLARLFPVVHPEHPEREAEYQRLMRDELITSRLEGIDAVQAVLARSGRKVPLDDAEMAAFAQAVNGVRLVLGTMLDVSEDDDVDPELLDTPEHHLYGFLSWLLDAAVRAMSGRLDGA